MDRQNPTLRGEAKRRKFLESLAKTGNVRRSCLVARLDRADAYEIRKADPAFASAWSLAIEDWLDSLEEEADRRGRRGIPKAVFYQGERCDNGEVLEYSDSLLALLLNKRHPVYRDKEHDDDGLDVELRPPERLRKPGAVDEHGDANAPDSDVSQPGGD